MRFLVDMPLSPDLADWLTRHGHDAAHAYRLGLGRASDGKEYSRDHELPASGRMVYDRV